MKTASDRPIDSAAEDTLGRVALAETFAARIQDVDSTDHGLVVGVLGPWGAGKTSFVNLVRRHLEPDLTVLEFNPWMFSGTTDLVDSFFIELSAQLQLVDRLESVGARLADYGEAFSGLGWLPVVGPWLERARGVSRLLKQVMERRRKGTAGPRARLEEALLALDAPVVVALDDIDRLTSPEVRQVFKLIRLIANLPNIVYLVAFDRHRVERALDDDGVPGRDYLEKILQVAVDLPLIPTDVLHRQVFDALNNALAELDHRPLDEERWPDVFAEVISPLIRNMRDVTRYANALHWTVRDIGDEVDLVDLLALEAVRVFLPDVFALLPTAVEGLTKPSSPYIGGTQDPDHLRTSVEALLEGSTRHEAVVRQLIERLFPAGARHVGGMSYASDFQSSWLRARRVAHPDLLLLYLERVAGGSLKAYLTAERLFHVMADENDFREHLGSIDRTRREDVIAGLGAFEDEFAEEHVLPGVSALLNTLPQLPERRRGMFDFGPRITVGRVTLRLLRALGEPDGVEAAVDEILPTLDGLATKLELLDTVGYRPGRGHRLVSEDFYNIRLRGWRQQVREADAAQLAVEYDLARMLWSARTDSDDEPQVEVPDHPEITAALLRSLTSGTVSQSMGSRAVRRHKRIAWDSFVELLGEEEANRRVEQPELAELVDEEVISLARRYASGWRPDNFG